MNEAKLASFMKKMPKDIVDEYNKWIERQTE